MNKLLAVILVSLIILALVGCESQGAATPTPRLNPCPSQAEQAYFDSLRRELQRISYVAGDVDKLFDEVDNNKSLILSPGWQLDLENALMQWLDRADDMQALSVPRRANFVYAVVETIAENVRTAALQYALGVDYIDPDAIALANRALRSVVSDMRLVYERMDTFCS